MNSVDALGATRNSESLDKVTKELTGVTSFRTLSRDYRVWLRYLSNCKYVDTTSHATRWPICETKKYQPKEIV